MPLLVCPGWGGGILEPGRDIETRIRQRLDGILSGLDAKRAAMKQGIENLGHQLEKASAEQSSSLNQ